MRYLIILLSFVSCVRAGAEPHRSTPPPREIQYTTEVDTYGERDLILTLRYTEGRDNIVASLTAHTPAPIQQHFGQCRTMRVIADGYNFPVTLRYRNTEIPNYHVETLTFYIPVELASYADSVDTVRVFMCGSRFGLNRTVLAGIANFAENATQL